MSFDACGMDPTMSRECQEALLLAGEIIAGRANIVPDGELRLSSDTYLGSPMSLDDIYERMPDLACINDAENLAQLDIDHSSLFIKKEPLQDPAFLFLGS